MNKIIAIINELRAYETEREWFEFKVNWFEPGQLGEYISALSNSAAYAGRKKDILYGVLTIKPMQ